ncbi:nitrite reductase large subunit NirB [Chromobacterium piscinae]|uniref:nitrite reductase large subunit NirB n=1 Tax=Chromobacterium piscinae TaxID=686831 RepID=UPI0031FD6214
MDMAELKDRARQRLVVVGNGMAGIRAVEELLALAPDLYDITVFGAEPHPNYNRILLSPVLAGEQAFGDIVLNPPEWYAERSIALHMGKRVSAIDRARREVVAEDGAVAGYDRLLLATGSSPVMLPIPGRELDGVIGYRDIADTEYMMEAAGQRRAAVVIGGGLLGLEAANGLRLRGMDVAVVHLADWLLERQLDRQAGELLRRALEARGIRFLMGRQTAALQDDGQGRVRGVRFSDGEEIPAELVVMAVGIRPNAALAEAAGLHCSRGVVVDDTLQTSDPRIYAVGECASHRGVAYGLVAPLFEQAKVCANHLARLGVARYGGSVPSTKLKVTGIDLFSAGDFMGGDGCEEIVLSDPAGGVYKKLVLRGDKLAGVCLYGDTSDGAWYFKLLREGRSVADLRDTLMFGETAIGDAGVQGQSRAAAMKDEDEVCGCNGVCKGAIVKAIQDKGLFTLDEVKKHTKAASSCGSCSGLVEQMLMSVVGSSFQETPKTKAVCGCTGHSHAELRQAIRERHLQTHAEVFHFLEWRTPNGCASCRPAINTARRRSAAASPCRNPAGVPPC